MPEAETSRDLRVGYIPYLNCAPFFHYLFDQGFSGFIIPGVPSALNRMLQTGDIDISPSSSFEYALNSENYVLLPRYSISSCGPVKSVLLFSPCALNELKGRKIAVTGDSATSIHLLRVLLLEYIGLPCVEDYVPTESVESLVEQNQPALLIGDRAMQQALNLPASMRCFDLGQLWYEYTKMPFVFALWILRRDIGQCREREVKNLQRAIDASLAQAFSDLPFLASTIRTKADELTSLVEYWQTIDYSLTQKHLAGLELFYRLCIKHGYLANFPKIEFFQG